MQEATNTTNKHNIRNLGLIDIGKNNTSLFLLKLGQYISGVTQLAFAPFVNKGYTSSNDFRNTFMETINVFLILGRQK